MQERRLIILFFIYLVLEGALRKWVLPSLSTPLFLIKDVLLGLVVVVYFGKRMFFRSARRQAVFLGSEALFLVGWVFYTCSSLLVTGISLTAFIGLSYYLVMLPLVVVIPRIIHDLDDLEYLLTRYIWLAVPVLLLGILQFNSAPDAYINRYAWSNADFGVATLGLNKARITGTFSYISPYAVYLQSIFLVALALMVFAKTERLRVVMSAIVFLILINIVMTGSRAPFLVALLLAVPFLVRFSRILKRSRGAWSLLLVMSLVGALVFSTGNVFDLLSERNKDAGDSSQRISGVLFIPFYTYNSINLVGSGIGSTFMGVRESGGTEEVGFDEVQADRLGIELGSIGYLFILCFKLAFLINNWKLYRKARDQRIQTWALVALCIQLSYQWGIPVYNAVAAAFYFGSIGLYVFLRSEQARLDNATSSNTVTV